MSDKEHRFSDILWRIYHRPAPPEALGGWWQPCPGMNQPLRRRMLKEHLDQSHGAASRVSDERELQINWLREKLGVAAGHQMLDMTCGPGLYAVEFARQGCQVTGVDFSPAAIAYAREYAGQQGVAASCSFLEQDVRTATFPPASLMPPYSCMANWRSSAAKRRSALLQKIAIALKPGGRLAIELLDQERVDKSHSSWWFTDDKGLWGDRPFLHLGERTWLAEEKISVEQFTIIDLETATATEINLSDQTYAVPEMVKMLREAGFSTVDVHTNSGEICRCMMPTNGSSTWRRQK